MLTLSLTDIDECDDERDICSNGMCINNQGSFRCACPSGFVLGNDGRTCLGKYDFTCFFVFLIISLVV